MGPLRDGSKTDPESWIIGAMYSNGIDDIGGDSRRSVGCHCIFARFTDMCIFMGLCWVGTSLHHALLDGGQAS